MELHVRSPQAVAEKGVTEADSELAVRCARMSRQFNGRRAERARLQQELGLMRRAGLAPQLLQLAALIDAGHAAGVPARLRQGPVTSAEYKPALAAETLGTISAALVSPFSLIPSFIH